MSERSDGRRGFLTNLFMWGGLLLSYGAAFLIGLRYLYPSRSARRKRLIYLAPLSDLPPGTSRLYALPDGSQALVTNTGADIVALSNICPHLGCKVHWEARHHRFLCPCHQGVFDSDGIAREGPPAAEGKNLKKYPLQTLGRNLFLEVEEVVPL